jgi:hypothetical protein
VTTDFKVPIMNERSATHPELEARASADDRDELCINTIRMLSIDAVQKADSGDPGMPIGAAEKPWSARPLSCSCGTWPAMR